MENTRVADSTKQKLVPASTNGEASALLREFCSVPVFGRLSSKNALSEPRIG